MARNLRLLVIDDEKESIKLPYIDLVSCCDIAGKAVEKLSRWTQHLQWYLSYEVPHFDLLFIDVNFKGDLEMPYPSDKANPFGLLHALPIAAQHHKSPMPFAWAIGSAYGDYLKDDSVAVFAFGLLCAMERRELPKESAMEPYRYFRSLLGDLQPIGDRQVFARLLGRYRDRLKSAAEDGRLEFDLDELRAQVASLAPTGAYSGPGRAGLGSRAVSLPDVTIYHGYQTEEIAIRSLLADIDGDERLRTDAHKLLCELMEIAVQVDIYPAVVKVMHELSNNREGVSINSLVEPANRRASLIKLGVIVCVWLEEYALSDKGRIKADHVTHRLGLGEWGQVHAILQKAGINLKLMEFFERLGAEALPLPSLFTCAARFWDENLRKKTRRELPGCLASSS